MTHAPLTGMLAAFGPYWLMSNAIRATCSVWHHSFAAFDSFDPFADLLALATPFHVQLFAVVVIPFCLALFAACSLSTCVICANVPSSAQLLPRPRTETLLCCKEYTFPACQLSRLLRNTSFEVQGGLPHGRTSVGQVRATLRDSPLNECRKEAARCAAAPTP